MAVRSVPGSWLLGHRPRPAVRLRLFCLPYAGGGASVFRSWGASLPDRVEVCPIQLPGRENRLLEPPFTRLPALADTLADALHPHLDLPFAVFGHSMGSLVAFELTRTLRRRQRPLPVSLLVSGRRAPQVPDVDPPIHHLPELEFLEEIRRLNGAPEEVLGNSELMELLLPALRADFEVCETYEYRSEEPLDCPIIAFGGDEDPEVGPEELDAWRRQTSGRFELYMFPGDHFYLFSARDRFMATLAAEVRRLLDRLLEGGGYE